MEVFDHAYEDYQEQLGKTKECKYCGELSSDDFCDRECYTAYIND